MEAVNALNKSLRGKFRVKIDDRDNMRPGAKYFEWEQKGVPLRLEIGPRDVAKGQAFAKKRTGGGKFGVAFEGAVDQVQDVLDGIQAELLERAELFQTTHIHDISSREQFVAAVKDEVGFFRVAWGGDDDDEVAVKNETKATLRCYPMVQDSVEGLTCPLTGKPAREWALFARAY